MLELDVVKAAMARTNALFNEEVVQKRNYDALTRIYTSGARILPPGAPMIAGLPEIKNFWKSAIESLNVTSAVLESVSAVAAGDGVVEIGAALLTLGGDTHVPAKYVVHWQEDEGTWKWDIDIWNMNA